VEMDDDLEDKVVELIQMKKREDESVELYIYHFDTYAGQVRYAIDKEDLICWFISGLNEPCCSKVILLSLTSFDAAKTIAEIIEKHLLEAENKEKIVGIMNDDKEMSETNNKDMPVAYCDEILQQDTKSLDIDEISHEAEIVEYEIEIMSELEKVKMDEVKNLRDGLLDWLTIIGNGYLEKYNDEDMLVIKNKLQIGDNEHYANMGMFTMNNLGSHETDNHGWSYSCVYCSLIQEGQLD
ncbi:12011_t:CDS:2, partial [Gigaspora margarita]